MPRAGQFRLFSKNAYSCPNITSGRLVELLSERTPAILRGRCGVASRISAGAVSASRTLNRMPAGIILTHVIGGYARRSPRIVQATTARPLDLHGIAQASAGFVDYGRAYTPSGGFASGRKAKRIRQGSHHPGGNRSRAPACRHTTSALPKARAARSPYFSTRIAARMGVQRAISDRTKRSNA